MDANYLRGMHHFSNGGHWNDGPFGDHPFSLEADVWMAGWRRQDEFCRQYSGEQSFIRGMKYKQAAPESFWMDNEYDPYQEPTGYINWLAGFNHARLKMEGKL